MFNLKFLCNPRPDLLRCKVPIKNSTYSFRGDLDWKTIDNYPCFKLLIVQIFQENVSTNDSSRLSKGCSSETRGSIASMTVTMKQCTPKKLFVCNFSQLVFCIEVRTVPKLNGACLLNHVEFQAYFSVS